MPMHSCPLCGSGETGGYHTDRRRSYLHCPTCALVFVPPADHLTPEDEKAEYDHHQNDPADARYRRFLSRLFDPMQTRLPAGSRGLDFGCGPGPTLSVMFEEVGHRVALFDPYYAPDVTILEATYAFITASEVVEHLREPGRELDRLWDALQPGGLLGILTQPIIDQTAFTTWRYTQDPTHIAFYAPATMHWLARYWGASLEQPARDVFLFKRA